MRERIQKFLDRFESRWSLWILLGTLSFGVPAWAASTLDLLKKYSPASWVAAGFLGVLIFALVVYLGVLIRDRLILSEIRKRFYEAGDKINPLENYFRSRRIHLRDLLPPAAGMPDVINKTFEDCELVGPLCLIPNGCRFDGCTWVQSDHAIITMERYPRTGRMFQSCTFRRCKFYFVTFLIPERIWQSFDVAHWITALPSGGQSQQPPAQEAQPARPA